MRYLILVPDGAADEPAADGRTALDIANMPNIDALASRGEVGFVKTIPDGVSPGSDAANLAVLGYDPASDLTGRSPLEAVSLGINMDPSDVAFRVNLVTLSGRGPFEYMTMEDHSAGDITTEEGRVLINYIDMMLGTGDLLNDDRLRFFPGVSYRHVMMVYAGNPTATGIGDVADEIKGYKLTPPHDILGKRINEYLPQGPGTKFITKIMKDAPNLLANHPINNARKAAGKHTADAIWIWGEGKKPSLASFKERFGLDGSVITAVDLIKGIGKCAGLTAPSVSGATGTLDTNFAGKAARAIDEFEGGKDFVFIHVEAPDECSHQGSLEGKIKALELIDREIAEPVSKWLKSSGEPYRILVVPDHRTPVALRTHTSDPVPFVLFDSENEKDAEGQAFNEKSGEKGTYFDSGKALAAHFFERESARGDRIN